VNLGSVIAVCSYSNLNKGTVGQCGISIRERTEIRGTDNLGNGEKANLRDGNDIAEFAYDALGQRIKRFHEQGLPLLNSESTGIFFDGSHRTYIVCLTDMPPRGCGRWLFRPPPCTTGALLLNRLKEQEKRKKIQAGRGRPLPFRRSPRRQPASRPPLN
jgi:hypothetical protein